MGRTLEDSQQRNFNNLIHPNRPKSEKFQGDNLIRKIETSSTNLKKKYLDDYICSLSNFELKQKLDSCPGKLGECPVINGFREGLKKSLSNHLNFTLKNDTRLCKTSRNYSCAKDCNSERMPNPDTSKSSEKKGATKNIKATYSNTCRSVIRSTRAQDLRSQSNRDLLRPKTVTEKTRTPYATAVLPKKKKCSSNGNQERKSLNRSNQVLKTSEEKKKQSKAQSANDKNVKPFNKGKTKKDKPSSADNSISLQRQKTQEIINPKIVKKTNSNLSRIKVAAGDSEPPGLKKSQTFFICKGTKNGEGDKFQVRFNNRILQADSISDASDEEVLSPKPNPLTHNDSFCLIAKSSQQWSQKNRSDDEKWLQYDLSCEEKSKKPNDKGILKNANYDLKSVDSLEKIESEKIVRFSDEMTQNKKVLKKLVRRKKRLQNFFAPTWYQKNKLFQKYFQILREKSVLLSEALDIPDNLKPFQVPIQMKEKYEAEMFGLCLRKGKPFKNPTKNAYSY